MWVLFLFVFPETNLTAIDLGDLGGRLKKSNLNGTHFATDDLSYPSATGREWISPEISRKSVENITFEPKDSSSLEFL